MSAGHLERLLTMWGKDGPRGSRAQDTARVQLYGKKGCHLCSVAKGIISRVRKEIRFELQEIDIESSRELCAQFKERIPVLFIDGREAFVYKINERKLKRVLRNESAGVKGPSLWVRRPQKK